MSVLALSLGYIGWAALAFAMARNYRLLMSKAPSRILVVLLRLLGAAALVGSLLVCADQWGWPRGSIALFGVLSVSGLALIAILAVSSRAVVAGAVCLSIGHIVAMVWG